MDKMKAARIHGYGGTDVIKYEAHAAALPHVTLKACQALFEMASLARGQSVLIHAAAGGVGHIAV